MENTHLVVGANGFLGSHVVRQLLEAGNTVRAGVRATADLRALQGLDCEVAHIDLDNPESLHTALQGVSHVYYCIVDTRAWLLDPAPLFETNVQRLKQALAVFCQHPLERFVFTSTIGTIGRVDSGLADEKLACNWQDQGGGYIKSRVEAENAVLECVKTGQLNAIVLCVANTYGAQDWQPTPHGDLVRKAAQGKLPAVIAGTKAEVVAIEDAASALVQAGKHGRIGERYIISERYADMAELYRHAARYAGQMPPAVALPLPLMYGIATMGDIARRLTGKDLKLCRQSLRLMHIMSPMSHDKAMRELHWQPRPIHEAIHRAVDFFCKPPAT